MFELAKKISVAIILMLLPVGANAQDDQVAPDPILCLQTVEALHPNYQAEFRPACMQLAGDFCATRMEPEACLTDLNATLKTFFDGLSPQLPAQMSDNPRDQKAYEEALETAQMMFSLNPLCQGSTGMGFETCTFLAYNSSILSLLDYAADAGVWP